MSNLYERMNEEITAMALHAHERGLKAPDAVMVCAVLTGVLLREYTDGDQDRRETLASVYRIMAAQAGLSDGKTN